MHCGIGKSRKDLYLYGGVKMNTDLNLVKVAKVKSNQR